MNKINYDHSQNLHLLNAPSQIFPLIKSIYNPQSVLDVGCGTGTWLKIVSEQGISDFFGIDGIELKNEQFLVSKEHFLLQNLTNEWNLGRTFDLVFCLEVAEHLPPESAKNLIKSLTNHSETIIFSAACPSQGGQGHINCQWPNYWQELFNKYGYICVDEIRPIIWDWDFPEYWYKQNIFVAKKDINNAGKEKRIASIVYPTLYESYCLSYSRIASGEASLTFYSKILLKKILKKFSLKK